MTAHSRGRFRAPWLALPLALLTLVGSAAPAFADDVVPTADAPAPVVEPVETPTTPAAPAVETVETPAAPSATDAPADVPTAASTPRKAAAAAVTPQITVTPSTFDPAVTTTLTVTGSGFTGDGAINGTYVVLGKTADWSAGTSPAGVTFPVQAWVMPGQVTDGAFTTTLNVAGKLTVGTDYSVGTFAAHALAYTNRTLDIWSPLTLFTTPVANPVITVSPTTIDPSVANTVTVSGTGFVGAGAVNGTYVVLGKTADWSTGTSPAGVSFPVQAWVMPGQITAGAFTTTLSIPAGALTSGTAYSVGTFAAHALAYTNRTLDTWNAFAVTGGSTGPGTSPGTDPNPPTTPPGSAAPRLSVSPGTVDPSVATVVTVSGSGYRGAGAANGVYVSIGSSSQWRPGQIPSQGGWVVTAWVTPANLSSNGGFTTSLRIPAGALTEGGSYGVASFAAHELSLTNRSLDAWTALKLGVAGSGTAAAATTRTAAEEPPADEGIDLESDSVSEGGEVTATASGFEAHETGILVVVYSDPVVLDNNATADADGTVRWTGRLPGGLSGSHTLTFQGSTEVGVPIEIAPRTAQECTVEDARLTWGFKESFRSYISGTIANGEWTTSGDAGYETPSFFWTGGTGDRSDEVSTGSTTVVQFDGAVRFTGHGGALDTTVSNPRVEVGEDSAVLLLDVSGTTQDGRDVIRVAVPFANLDLSGVEPVTADGVISLSGIPATLTTEGAEVFGTYPAGEQLDPVTLALPAGDCGAPAADGVNAAPASSNTPAPVWPVLVGVAVPLIAIAIVAAVLLRRRRAA